MNLPIMKLTIRLLVLMIFFVIIFLISTVLYSTRYWPDVYNYIHANITIKRIPTLSELNLTILEVETEVTTEYYGTTDDFTNTYTVDGIDIDIDEFTKIDSVNKSNIKNKRAVPIENFYNDYNEIPSKSVIVEYMFIEDTEATEATETTVGTTEINKEITEIAEDYVEIVEDVFLKKLVKDLIDESKLLPKDYGDFEMVDRKEVKPEKIVLSCHGNKSGISQVYPWIATIFITNDTTSNQFEYYCDGALLTENVLITSARCVITDSPVDPEDVLVFLGKRSLQIMTGNEQIVKINKIRIHENFTKEGRIKNDIALLYFEEAVTSTDDFRPACFFGDTNETSAVERSATTAWTVQGDMVPIYFNKKNTICDGEDGETSTICDSYGLEVPLCPSYGGIYVSKLSTGWYLRGIRKADPSARSICYSKDVQYTPLEDFGEWLTNNLDNKH